MLARVALAALLGRQRAFRPDAQRLAENICPATVLYGQEHLPRGGPGLITPNHFHCTGFGGLWLGIAISAVVPVEITWVVTSAWTGRGWMVQQASTRMFAAVTRVYGFLPMPPMPPRPGDEAARAEAVRGVLRYARSHQRSLIGLVPEGMDAPGAALSLPPHGAGRFLLALAQAGLPVQPVGIYREAGRLALRFGPAYRLEECVDVDQPAKAVDRQARAVVMQRIAACLPAGFPKQNMDHPQV